MRYLIGISAALGLLTWRAADVQHAADAMVQALGSLLR
jgi:hypothetical protein